MLESDIFMSHTCIVFSHMDSGERKTERKMEGKKSHTKQTHTPTHRPALKLRSPHRTETACMTKCHNSTLLKNKQTNNKKKKKTPRLHLDLIRTEQSKAQQKLRRHSLRRLQEMEQSRKGAGIEKGGLIRREREQGLLGKRRTWSFNTVCLHAAAAEQHMLQSSPWEGSGGVNSGRDHVLCDNFKDL